VKNTSYRKLLKVVAIILAIILFVGFFNKFSEYYFRRPTIAILLFIGGIVLLYLIVFFKEIFLRGKSNRNSH
jgi:hypothetical protein